MLLLPGQVGTSIDNAGAGLAEGYVPSITKRIIVNLENTC